MTEHTANVTSYTERGRDGPLMKGPTTYATIEVRPPIRVGRSFIEAVLGDEACLIDLEFQQQNGRRTVFDAESSMHGLENRHADIEKLAERIGRLANHPEDSRKMREERPFPEPKESQSGVEPVVIPPPAECQPKTDVPLVDSAPGDVPYVPPPLDDLSQTSPVELDMEGVLPPVEIPQPELPPIGGSRTVPIRHVRHQLPPDAELPWTPRSNGGGQTR